MRVSAEGEAYGLDLHEHGISAYPEYVISSVPDLHLLRLFVFVFEHIEKIFQSVRRLLVLIL